MEQSTNTEKRKRDRETYGNLHILSCHFHSNDKTIQNGTERNGINRTGIRCSNGIEMKNVFTICMCTQARLCNLESNNFNSFDFCSFYLKRKKEEIIRHGLFK